MANKTINMRSQQKVDISTNWAAHSSFVPLEGEIIVYSDLNRIKIGDGSTTISALEFADTTYENKEAAASGTDVSLVTTGEKYTWNNKVSIDSSSASFSLGVDDSGLYIVK